MLNWDTLTQTGCLVLFIIIIVLIFFLFKPSSKNYYDIDKVCPELTSLCYINRDDNISDSPRTNTNDNCDKKVTDKKVQDKKPIESRELVPVYKTELSLVLKKGKFINHVNNCKVYPIYIQDYSVYIKDKEPNTVCDGDTCSITRPKTEYVCIEDNIQLCPTLYDKLSRISVVRSIYIYKLQPSTELPIHYGDTEDNKYIRCVLPIKCMKLDSGISVNDEIKLNKINEWTVYDNSRKNYIFNSTNKPVIMLMVDIARPSSCLKGINERPPIDYHKLYEKIHDLHNLSV